MSEITLVLHAVGRGESNASEKLFPLVYCELRRLAAARMAQEAEGQTLQPTALVHEGWLRLVATGEQNWQNRAHFFAVAAQAMRRIMVDYVRRRRSLKRGGTSKRVDLDEAANIARDSHDDVLALDEALTRLETIDPRQSQIVELRYFSGLTEEETAAVMGIGLRTVKREWAVARAWLHAELTRGPLSSHP